MMTTQSRNKRIIDLLAAPAIRHSAITATIKSRLQWEPAMSPAELHSRTWHIIHKFRSQQRIWSHTFLNPLNHCHQHISVGIQGETSSRNVPRGTIQCLADFPCSCATCTMSHTTNAEEAVKVVLL